MSWQLLERPKTLKVTKALAKEFAEMEPCPNDRPLSERRLTVYANLLAKGLFRPVTWAKAICEETNGIYRVNGKHTSIILSGLKELPEFYVTVEEYECTSLDDVARLYATFDSSMQSRTASDIYQSFAGTVTDLKDLPRNTINLAVAGLAYAAWGQDMYQHQPPERAELLLEHVDFVLWSNLVLDGGVAGERKVRREPLSRLAVVAAMYATYRKAKGPATEFWAAVRDETGVSPSVPDRKLAKYLSSVACVAAGNRARKAAKADNREIYVKCLHSWNAWRKGESTSLNYYVEAKVPAIV